MESVKSNFLPVHNGTNGMSADANSETDFTASGAASSNVAPELAAAILDTAGTLVVVLDREGIIVQFNRACRQLTGYKFEEVHGRKFWDFLLLPDERGEVEAVFSDLRDGHFPNCHTNFWVAKNGHRHLIEWQNTVITDETGRPHYIIGTGLDITQQRRAEELVNGQAHLMELIALSAPLPEILQGITLLIESQNPQVNASIVLLDEDGLHLRDGAGPSLPPSFRQAIDGTAIGPRVGSCGAAVFRRETVIVEDIENDELWANYRDLARQYGLRACWSTPILARDGRSLGAFAMYYRETRRPTEEDFKLLRVATHIAGIAIKRHRDEALLRATVQRNSQLAGAVSNLTTGVVITDAADGHAIVFVNPAFTTMTGYSFEEAIGRNCRFLQGRQTDPAAVQKIREALSAERPLKTTLLNYRKDGTAFHNEMTINPVFGEFGEVKSYVGLLVDVTELKQAEESLRQSEERFHNFVANVPGMVYQFVMRPDGRIEWPFVSEGCRELYEASPEEIQAQPTLPIEVLHPDDRADFDRTVQESARTLQPWRWTGRYFRTPDEINWFKALARPQRLPDGGTLWDGVAIDITGRKRAEEALQEANTQLEANIEARTQALRRINRELEEELLQHQRTGEALRASESKFRSIVQSANDGIILADSQGIIIDWNPGAQTIFGYTHEEIVGQPLTQLMPTTYREAHLAGLKHSASGGQGNFIGATVEVEGLRNDGSAFPLEISLNSWTVESEVFFSSIVRDITQRKEILRRLEQEINTGWRLQEQLQLQIQRMPIGYVLWGKDGCIESWNPAAEAIFGYTAAEALGQIGFDFLGTEEGLPYLEELWQRLMIGDDTAHSINPNRTKSGRTIVCQWANTPLKDSAGEVIAVLSMVQDVTEQQLAQQEMQAARDEAQRANQAKSEFLSRVSHELRTPLNAIIGFGQILQLDELEPLQTESVEHILKAGNHLLALINEVLDISRVEANDLQLSIEAVAVADVVDEAIALVRGLAQKHEVILDYDRTERCAMYALADRQRLKQVFINLLSNGVKYNRRGGRLTVICEHFAGEHARISISDTGSGIAPEDLHKLFMPFERLNAGQSAIPGTGLGLALSRNLIEAMNGRLDVKSIIGQGSTFYVDLPAIEDPRQAIQHAIEATQEIEATPGVTLQNFSTILLIEDNVSNYRLIETVLKKRPAVRLLGAMEGHAGLELARQHHPDLILLDLHLPDLHGTEVLNRLRAVPTTAHIPVVICSADATPPQIKRLLAAGAHRYLTKPINLRELLSVIDETLGTS